MKINWPLCENLGNVCFSCHCAFEELCGYVLVILKEGNDN